jgi:hypothetical protein
VQVDAACSDRDGAEVASEDERDDLVVDLLGQRAVGPVAIVELTLGQESARADLGADGLRVGLLGARGLLGLARPGQLWTASLAAEILDRRGVGLASAWGGSDARVVLVAHGICSKCQGPSWSSTV